MESYEFSAQWWIWDARGKEDGWTFLSVPTGGVGGDPRLLGQPTAGRVRFCASR